jgi:hypothetical protein
MQRPRAKIHYGQDIPGTRKASNLKSSSLVEGRVRPRPDSMAGLARSGVISSALLVSGMMSVRRPVSVSRFAERLGSAACTDRLREVQWIRYGDGRQQHPCAGILNGRNSEQSRGRAAPTNWWDAVERYLRLKRREKLYAYGEGQARKLGIREEDVPGLAEQSRQMAPRR